MSAAAFCSAISVRPQLPGSLGHAPGVRRRARPRRFARVRPRGALHAGTGSLPGVLVLPGLGNSAGDYAGLAGALVGLGHRAVAVAPVARWDWGRNASGLLRASYWRGTLAPADVLGWYFRRADAALAALSAGGGGGGDAARTAVVGHSAGGWLARAYIAARAKAATDSAPSPAFAALVTLGSPHTPPPSGAFDQTRGLLTHIARECHIDALVERKVCVAGAGVVGKQLGQGSVAETVAYYSYQALCGHGDVDGDGVIPVQAAFFADAQQIVVPGCGHSMVGGGSWYGSPGPMKEWQKFLV